MNKNVFAGVVIAVIFIAFVVTHPAGTHVHIVDTTGQITGILDYRCPSEDGHRCPTTEHECDDEFITRTH